MPAATAPADPSALAVARLIAELGRGLAEAADQFVLAEVARSAGKAPPTADLGKLLGTAEVSRQTGIPRTTLYVHMRAGRLKCLHNGPRYLTRPEWVAEFLDRLTVEG